MTIIPRAPSGHDDAIPPFCFPEGLDLAVILFVSFAVTLSWWIFEIPTIWLHGFGEFFRRLCWQAVRIHSPAYLAQVSIGHSSNPSDWPSIFYLGVQGQKDKNENITLTHTTRWDYVKMALCEIPTIIAAILCAYRWSIMDAETSFHPMTGAWIAACLPPTVVGIGLSIASRIRWKHIAFVYLIGALALIGVGVAYILGNIFSSRQGALTTSGIAWICVCYGIVMVPWLLLPLIGRTVVVYLALVLTVFVRACGVFLTIGDVRKFELCTTQTKGIMGYFIGMNCVTFIILFLGVAMAESLRDRNRKNTTHEGATPLQPQNQQEHHTASDIENHAWSAQNTTQTQQDDTASLLSVPPPPYEPPPSYTR